MIYDKNKNDSVAETNGTRKSRSTGSAPGAGSMSLARKLAHMSYNEGIRFLKPKDEGNTGSNSDFPFHEQIQSSFGVHQISREEVVSGGEASEHAQRLGAKGFVKGGRAFLPKDADLEVAAHEAVHIVQQRALGASEKTIAQDDDLVEQQADSIARKVSRGENVEADLDRVVASGHKAPAILLKREKKSVTPKAKKRLDHATQAIQHTKNVLCFGAGNQLEALKQTRFNSYFRLLVMRRTDLWELDESVKELAAKYPEALTAAKADIAKGGNCGEHAQIAFDFLRASAKGETINLCDVTGLDHAFVMLGKVHSRSEKDSDLVVSDPWPTSATAVLWEDHFAYTDDRKQINLRRTQVADGQNVKEVIARGLKLKPEGYELLHRRLSEEETQKELKKGTSGAHPWIWHHPHTYAEGRDYEYVEQKEE